MIKLRQLPIVAVLTLAFGPSAFAAVAYTSPDFTNAANPAINAWCSSCFGEYQVSDQFTLSSGATLSGVDFAIQESYGSVWNIEISVWDASLTTQLFSTTMTNGSYGVSSLGNDVAMVSASFAGPALAAGSYRMSWYEPVNMGIPGYALGTTLWSSDPQIGGSIQENGDGAAFQIYAAVPEPSTYALMALGLLAVGAVARRKSKT